jgi:hypothetical protein
MCESGCVNLVKIQIETQKKTLANFKQFLRYDINLMVEKQMYKSPTTKCETDEGHRDEQEINEISIHVVKF